jgi:organic radical activating enzyme
MVGWLVMKAVIYSPEGSFLDYPTEDYCVGYFFHGCDFRCPNCHNSDLQTPPNLSKGVTVDQFIDKLYDDAGAFGTYKIALMGGDPLSTYNEEFTYSLLQKADDFEFCVYTGYELEDLDVDMLRKSSSLRFLKTGVFDESKFVGSEKTNNFFQLASTNQKLYELVYGELVLVSSEGKYKYN